MNNLEIAASGVVDGWLEIAIAHIDERLGAGYAFAHPELVGAFITACAAQVRNSRLEEDIAGTLEAIATQLGSVAAALAQLQHRGE